MCDIHVSDKYKIRCGGSHRLHREARLLNRHAKGGGRPWCPTGGPQQPNDQPLRFAGASPSSKDETTASVASASSEAATVRAPNAMRYKAAAAPIPTADPSRATRPNSSGQHE